MTGSISGPGPWRATRPFQSADVPATHDSWPRSSTQRVGDDEWPAVPALAEPGALAELLHALAHLWMPPQVRFPTQRASVGVRDDPYPLVPERSSATADNIGEIALVLDDSLAMTGWHATLDAFTDLVGQQEFRSVLVYHLDTDAAELALYDRITGESRPPAALAAPDSERIVLVITDASGRGWRTGEVSKALATWGHAHPVALLHVLPQQRWPSHSLPIRMADLRAPTPGAANAPLTWRYAPSTAVADAVTDDTAGIPIPVLELRPRWLRSWLRLTGASAWARMPVIITNPEPATTAANGSSPVSDPDDLKPGDRVLKVRAAAAPDALTLATHFAAAPLNLPVMRLIQGILLPHSTPLDLYEVLSGNLMEPCVPRADLRAADRITFNFLPGVRQELLSFGDRSDTIRVLRTVGQYLGRRVPAVRHLEQAVDQPEHAQIPTVTADTAPFLEVERIVLEALSGRWLTRARHLRQALEHSYTSVQGQCVVD